MSAATMREQLERAMTTARTIGEERLIGRAIVELQEATDFRECAELHAVTISPDFTLLPQLRAAGQPHHTLEGA